MSAELTRLAHEVVSAGREFVQHNHKASRSTKEATKAIVQRKDAIVALRDDHFKVTERSKGEDLSIVIDGVVFTGYWKDFRKTYLGGVSDRHLRRLLGDKPEKKQREKVVRIKVGDTIVIGDEVKETMYEVTAVTEKTDKTASISLKFIDETVTPQKPSAQKDSNFRAPKAQKVNGRDRDDGRRIVPATQAAGGAMQKQIKLQQTA